MSDLRLLKRRLALTSILINGGFHLHLLVFPITMTGKTRYKVGPLYSETAGANKNDMTRSWEEICIEIYVKRPAILYVHPKVFHITHPL